MYYNTLPMPATTADSFAQQLQRAVVEVLDEMTPNRRRLLRPSKAATKWLSREAVEAKRLRRRLEHKRQKAMLEACGGHFQLFAVSVPS